jgi:3-oxoacyl-[acyl-carrier-protein] synthase-1
VNSVVARHGPCRLAALGAVNAAGANADEIWRRVVAGDTSRLTRRAELVADGSMLVGEVHDELSVTPESLARYDCRNNRLSLAALVQIQTQIYAAIDRYGAARIGVVMGTSTSGTSAAEAAIRHRESHGVLAPAFRYDQFEFGGASGFVRECLGTDGPAYTLSTACSSGAKALVTAR